MKTDVSPQPIGKQLAQIKNKLKQVKSINCCKIVNSFKLKLEMCPQYTDATPRPLAPPRGMTLGQRYHTLKSLDVGKCHNFLAQKV